MLIFGDLDDISNHYRPVSKLYRYDCCTLTFTLRLTVQLHHCILFDYVLCLLTLIQNCKKMSSFSFVRQGRNRISCFARRFKEVWLKKSTFWVHLKSRFRVPFSFLFQVYGHYDFILIFFNLNSNFNSKSKYHF